MSDDKIYLHLKSRSYRVGMSPHIEVQTELRDDGSIDIILPYDVNLEVSKGARINLRKGYLTNHNW